MYESNKLGKNLTDIQEINRSLVLNNIRSQPNCSRSQIAANTGLQQATITKIVNDLIRAGMVLETSLFKKSEKGRRSIGLTLNTALHRIIGVRLTRSRILVGLFDINGKQHNLICKNIDISRGAKEAIGKMVKAIKAMMDSSGEGHILGIGVGLPGFFIKDEGIIAVMADFPGWEGFSVKKVLESEFGGIVYTEHDAYAQGLAEWWFGRKRETSNILLSIGMEEGLGAGLVIQGKVYYGSQGIAGEIGHVSIDFDGIPCVCGNRGCLRNYCTEAAVIQQAREGLKTHTHSKLKGSFKLGEIIDCALKGDKFAADLIRKAGRFLGYGIMNAIYAYNPDTIILSRRFFAAGDLYLNAIREVLRERLLPVFFDRIKLEFSALDADPVLLGVVSLVTDKIFMTPSYILELSQAKRNGA